MCCLCLFAAKNPAIPILRLWPVRCHPVVRSVSFKAFLPYDLRVLSRGNSEPDFAVALEAERIVCKSICATYALL